MINSYQNKVYKKSQKRFYHDEFSKNIANYHNFKEKLDILDIGCGNGDLCFSLSKKFSNANFYGIDLDKNNIKFAIKRAKLFSKKKKFTFIHKNFEKFNTKKKFDIVIASGFLCFFTDINKPINKMIKLINSKKGKIFLFGDFNSSGVDKIVKFRNNNIKRTKEWMDGFSSYSIYTIKKFFFKKKFDLKIVKFKLPKNIGNFNSDPTRSISRLLSGCGRIVFNRANIIFEFNTLIFKKR